MNRLISDILEAPEPHFSHRIQAWEKLSNNAGHDLRLLSDIAKIRREILRELGLDEVDTTPKELFFALRHRAADTNQQLEEKLGVTKDDSPEELVKKIIKQVEALKLPLDVWTLKPATVKKLLKQQPPKKLLKTLGLRSIDSAIKNVGAEELYALAILTESAEWKEKTRLKYKKFGPSDFSSSKISLHTLDSKRLEKLRKTGFNGAAAVIPNYVTGSVIVLPPVKRFEFDSLGLTLFLLYAMRDIRMHSAYFRHISVKNDFGNKLFDAINEGLPSKKEDLEIGWRSLQRHFNHNTKAFSVFEQPFLQHEDILVISPEKELTKILPAMELWRRGRHGFLTSDGSTVSMHLLDVVTDASNKRSFEKSTRGHLKNGLWEELGYRYLQSEPIAVVVMERF